MVAMTVEHSLALRYLPACMHNHARQGTLMEYLVRTSALLVGYEAEEPNTGPPIVTWQDAIRYRREIMRAAGDDAPSTYKPLIGVYVTEASDPDDIALGFEAGDIHFVKWYPPHGTTASEHSVPVLSPAYCRIAERAERIGIPFQHHGELTHFDSGEEIDHQDREAVFYGEKFPEIRHRWPGMRYLGEHLTTEDGVSAIIGDPGCGGTITPWHLLEDRKIVNRGGMNPLYAIMPALKRQKHVDALRHAIQTRNPRLFAGPDTAAHPIENKSKPTGCACGIYSPWWIEWYAVAFENMGMLEYLEAFLCTNGPMHYGLEPIFGSVILEKRDVRRYPVPIQFGPGKGDVVLPFGYHPDPAAEATGLRMPLHWYARRES